MRLTSWVLIAAALSITACDDIDRVLGSEDGEYVTMSVPSSQPSDPADGINVDVLFSIQQDSMLGLSVEGGMVQIAGDGGPAASQCIGPFKTSRELRVIVTLGMDKKEAVLLAGLYHYASGTATDCPGIPDDTASLSLPAKAATDGGVDAM